MTANETWKPIEETNGRYSVSDLGRVRGVSGKILRPTLMQIGYYSVAFSLGNFRVTRKYLHRLVAEAFAGPLPADAIVNHKNHDKLDNRLSNLEVIDRPANARHWAGVKRSPKAGRKRTGLCGRGHKLIGERTYCLECRRNASAGHVFSPPADTTWRESFIPGYLISTDGRLWSTKFSRLLRPGVNSPGYEYFNLRVDGRTKPFATHRLVAEAFLGAIGPLQVVDHINGNKRDNRVENLRLTSRSENTTAFRDRMRQEGRHGYKIDERIAAEIKWLLENGRISQIGLARQYGVSPSLVHSIAQGRQWRHVASAPPKHSRNTEPLSENSGEA